MIALALAAVSAPALEAQDGTRVAATALFQSYTFGEPDNAGIETLTLISTPFSARVPLGSRFSITARGAFATATLARPDGSESSISGLTDTDVAAEVRLADDRLLIAAVLIAPTGYASHDDEEAQVAGAIAADLLPFAITNWGSGGGAGLHATAVLPMRSGSIALSGGYTAAQEFEPRSGEELSYRPGNEMRVQLAGERSFGRTGKATLQLGLNRYSDDAANGQNLYRSGDRMQAIGSYAFAVGYRASGVVYAGVQHRNEGTLIDSPETVAAQDLLFGGAGARMPVGRMVLVPSADMRLIRSDDGVGQGYVASVGSSAELGSGRMTFIPTARIRFGNLMLLDDVESGITGIEAGITIRFGSAR